MRAEAEAGPRAEARGETRPPAVAVMARMPAAGRVKRRLAKGVGPERAAELYQLLLDETLRTVEGLPGIDPVLSLADTPAVPGEPGRTKWRPPPEVMVLSQRGASLAERLVHTFTRLFERGHTAVLAVASDSPGLPAELLARGLEALGEEESDAVLGPCFDGGYYLLGIRETAWSRHLDGISAALLAARLGSSHAFDDTRHGLEAAGLTLRVLPAWVDLDEETALPLALRLLEENERRKLSPAHPARTARARTQAALVETGQPHPTSRGGPRPALREMYLHLTNHCTGSCPHCYVGREAPGETELPGSEWRRVVTEGYELGARVFTLLGGDPFEHPDFLEIMEEVTGREDAQARLFFSRALDGPQATRLARAGRGRLTPLLSIDGRGEVNDAIRGPGAYEGSLATLRRLREAGLPVGVNTVLLGPVLPTLPALVREVAGRGATRLHLILPHDRGRLTRNPDLLPAGHDLLEAVRKAEIAAEEAGIFLDNSAAWKARERLPRDLCSAGCSLCAVDARGRVYPCPITCNDPFFVAGDLRRDDLKTVWRRSPVLRLLRESHAADRPGCGTCEAAAVCGGDCWVQGHYAARAAGRPAGYAAPSPYCDFLRPLFAAPAGSAPAGRLVPFDCI